MCPTHQRSCAQGDLNSRRRIGLAHKQPPDFVGYVNHLLSLHSWKLWSGPLENLSFNDGFRIVYFHHPEPIQERQILTQSSLVKSCAVPRTGRVPGSNKSEVRMGLD